VGVSTGNHNTFLMVGAADEEEEPSDTHQNISQFQQQLGMVQERDRLATVTHDDEFYIDERLDDDNWLHLFRWAQNHGEREIIPQIVRFVVRQYQKRLIRRDTILSLKHDLFRHLIRSDYFSLPERDIFQLVVDWYESQVRTGARDISQKNDDEPKTELFDMKNIVKYVRLPLLDATYLRTRVRKFPFIDLNSYADAFEYVTVPEEFTDEETKGNQFQPRKRKGWWLSDTYFIEKKLMLVTSTPDSIHLDAESLVATKIGDSDWDTVIMSNQAFSTGYVYLEMKIEALNDDKT
jgi:hypothetical protein